MIALKKARKLIQADPETPSAKVLSALVIALESNQAFPLNQLYTLSYPQFELALEILAEWRLDRYYSSKGRLLDLSVHAAELQTA
ncbi:hypothetical protein [Hydrogenophaga sp. PBL-H3]|uniref:hypothetical protein n=1 Tax=Hydrogenophaga sp. PBL-H3 TaxID=434010 RepID=UPI00131F5E21|nr:hypothetical protein [Hydrogenophaga sp. PBL-H3]QHE75962.1 hypothetical protein F9Z45_07750 [Hydrogenophaga sp. PBL-H3]QHE80386.1 hypothetical protein F9Z44_07750 [Hydrogenophaga sp. PBL-H3]